MGVVKWAGVAVFSSPHLLVLLSPPLSSKTMMTIVGNSVPSSNYVVNVRCVQAIRPSTHPSYSDIVETAQRRIMLAQLVTDEAKPGSKEKWLRTYTDKLSALGIDMEDGAIADVDRSSTQGTLTDVIVFILTSEGWNRQIEVKELAKTALESLGNSKTQQAKNAFNPAAAQDVAGPTVAFEVQTLSAEDSGDLRIHSCWFSLSAKGSTAGDIFSPKATPEQFSIQYRISSGILDKDFANRTTRVIIEKAAPFYARSVRKVN